MRETIMAAAQDAHVERPVGSPCGVSTRKPWFQTAFICSLLLAVITAQAVVFHWKPVDDAFISFRYAQNMAQGYGLVFNPGERVEGYSNPLWTLLLAGASRAGFDLPRASCWLGLMFTAGSMWLTWLLAWRIAGERGWSSRRTWLAPVLLALYPGTAYWAYGGLEGPMAAFLVLGFWLLACERSASNRALVAGGILGVLAAMTRWEIALLWPIAVLMHATDSSRPLAARLRRGMLLGLVLTALFGVFFVVRFRYYGEWLPNTYYAKIGGTLLGRLARGIPYAAEGAVSWLLPLTLPVWLIVQRSARSWSIAAAVLVFGLYSAWTGGDHFCWLRFLLPVLPFAAVLAVGTVHELDRALVGRMAGTGRPLLVALGMILMVVGIGMRIDILPAREHVGFVTQWQRIGEWARIAIPGDYRIAIAPVGAMPYYSGHDILDMLGLTDRETAHFGQTDSAEPPGHQKSHVRSLLRRAPEIVLGDAAVFPHPPTFDEAAKRMRRIAFVRMCHSAEFQALYRYEVVALAQGYMPLWVRHDIAWDYPHRVRPGDSNAVDRAQGDRQ